MQGSERWRPLTGSNNPSARLRAARSMPQWLGARGSALPPPPPPPEEISVGAQGLHLEPDYEVIEFPGHQPYSNTPIHHVGAAEGRRCDLCGSSAPAVSCRDCGQQSFCGSCDEMYHRHPKRQNHSRKSVEPRRPPLPPKGEVHAPPPVPPPRRKQRRSPIAPQVQDQGSIVGSLRRIISGRPLPPAPPPPPQCRDRPGPGFADRQMMGREMGFPDWEMDRSHRSGSMTALNMQPAFGPLMQAHSMAQLNCPSCHHQGMMWGGDWGGGWGWPQHQTLRPRRYRRHSSSGEEEEDEESEEEEGRGVRRRGSLLEGRGTRRREEDTMSVRGTRRIKRRGMSLRGGEEERRRAEEETRSLRGGRRSEEEEVRSVRGGKILSRTEDDVRSLRGERTSLRSAREDGQTFKGGEEDTRSLRGGRRSEDDDTRSLRGGKKTRESWEDKREDSKPVREKRNERFTDTGRRRRSPVDLKRRTRRSSSGAETEDEASTPQEWECEHCTFINPPGDSRVCAVCCKTSLARGRGTGESRATSVARGTEEPRSTSASLAPDPQGASLSQGLARVTISPTSSVSPSLSNRARSLERRALASKGTSPPPQSISTQTYGVVGRPLKRATSLAEHQWSAPQRSLSRQSLLSDTQSLPVTPPRRSPDLESGPDLDLDPKPSRRSSEPLSPTRVPRRSSAPQPPEYISTLLQKQVKQGLEMVKLLREAEAHQFSAEDLGVALCHCGEEDPVQWLLTNWRNMIDTVVTLATNYGHERKENTVGTISAVEAREALRSHEGNVWAAVTECVEQRQAKYGELLARGNFSREDIVTSLTAHHGDLEAAYLELSKSQLRPFLMRIWGPPQGADNEAGQPFMEEGGTGVWPVAGVRSPDQREVRRLVGEGEVGSYDQGEVAVQLIQEGFPREQALLAAKECSTLQAARAWLQQECPLCASQVPMPQMVGMTGCEDRVCRECALRYFSVQVRERGVAHCVCPVCAKPELGSDPDATHLYLSNLDIMLKALLPPQLHELFQAKLRDYTLLQDPNFKWCVKCSSGFIADPRQKRLICPDCKTIICASCRRPWEDGHEGLSCEELAQRLKDNPIEEELHDHLEEHGIVCPKCNFTFSLAKGGCMHLTCTNCKHEFCSGCSKPFLLGDKCGFSEYCPKLGLHAHHPRNCLFFLRDKEPAVLEKLLQDHGVDYKKTCDENPTKWCRVQLLKETDDGFTDGVCGLPVESVGFCRKHYIEYLSRVVRSRGLETMGILSSDDLESVVKRCGLTPPNNAYGTPPSVYHNLLVQMVQQEVPLD